MRAIVQDTYGAPDVLQLRDIDSPAVTDDGVLIRVHAAAINPLDWPVTRGMPYIARTDFGLRKPSPSVRGLDMARSRRLART